MVVHRSSVNGSERAFLRKICSGFDAPGQAQLLADRPSGEHQGRHRGKAAGQAALQLCQGKAMADITIDVDASVAPTDGNSPTDFSTPGGNTVKSLILQPTPITAENLGDVINAGWWVTKDDICQDVKAGDPGADACGV